MSLIQGGIEIALLTTSRVSSLSLSSEAAHVSFQRRTHEIQQTLVPMSFINNSQELGGFPLSIAYMRGLKRQADADIFLEADS